MSMISITGIGRITLLMSLFSLLVLPRAAQTQRPEYTIAFSSFGTIRPNIFIADSNGTNVKPLLANPARDYNPSFSRDGSWIVFTSDRNGSADIYRVHKDGSGLERLTTDPSFDDQGTLSPDGRFLAFVSTRTGHANIWLLDMQTRRLKNLTAGSFGDFRPSWSPDGEFIAFSSVRTMSRPRSLLTDWSTSIYVMRSNGSEVRQVTHDATRTGGPAWMPDGRIICYRFNPTTLTVSQIISVDARNGEAQVLEDGPGFKWSFRWVKPIGLVYLKQPTGSPPPILVSPAGSIQGGIASTGAPVNILNADWSYDGESMVFEQETESSWPPFQARSSRDARFRLIRTGIFPSFSPAGGRFVVSSGRVARAHSSLLLMNADGTNGSVIYDAPATSALAPAWSPKGDQIAFFLGGFANPERQLALIRPDGSGMQRLPAAGDDAGFPSWSPDARRIVYSSANPQARGLKILNLDDQRIVQLTSERDAFPSWSPSGDRIVFSRHRDGDNEIYTVRPDGTQLARLTRSPGIDAHPSWSPDGRWIAFVGNKTGFKDDLPFGQTDGEVFVMRADGSDMRQLTDNADEDGTPTWIPR